MRKPLRLVVRVLYVLLGLLLLALLLNPTLFPDLKEFVKTDPFRGIPAPIGTDLTPREPQDTAPSGAATPTVRPGTGPARENPEKSEARSTPNAGAGREQEDR